MIISRGIKHAFLLGVAGVLLAMLGIACNGLCDQVTIADVIVVPGNTLGPDGKPSPRLRARLDAAFALFHGQHARYVFVSGGIGKEGFDEAASMSSYLVEKGIPQAAIIKDNLGVDTDSTAKNAATFMRLHNLRTALIATQYFHVPRMRMALKRHGVQVTGSLHPNFFELRDLYSTAREVPAYIGYFTKMTR